MYEKIIRKISSGLTGDSQKDIQYLKEQMEIYKNHELSKEIIRACGRMISKLIPDKESGAIFKTFDNEITAIEIIMDEIGFNIYKGEYEKALTISEGLIKEIEELDMFENDSVSEYYTFSEVFEELLYRFYNNPTREVRAASFPMSRIYFQNGSLLFETQQYGKARKALEKAIRWNPANVSMASEYIETFKQSGEIDEFFKLTKDVFKYAFRPGDVARCFRNFGFYFIEKEIYDAAVSCFIISLGYEPDNNTATSELYYIQSVTNMKIKEPSPEECMKCCEKYGMPTGASKYVIGLAYAYAKEFVKAKQNESALYFLNIIYDLTKDNKIKTQIDELKADKSRTENQMK